MRVCSLCSGSKGNSVYLEADETKVLFDAGKTFKYLSTALMEIDVNIKDIKYIFITHTHKDHIAALKDVLKKSNAILCITNKLFFELDNLKDFDRILIFEEDIIIDGIHVQSVKVSHDSPDARNYVVTHGESKFSFITDTGYINRKNFKYFENSNVFFIESNHDIELLENGPYPSFLKKRVISDEGHLSNKQAGFYLTKLIGLNTKNILLFHLSDTNNDPEIALETVTNTLIDYDVNTCDIKCAMQDEVSEVITL